MDVARLATRAQTQCYMGCGAKLLQTEKTKLRRKPERGVYDRELVNAILNEAFICHLAFVCNDQPYGLPTLYGRDRNRLLVHGAYASRMLRTLAMGVRVCFTATLMDGLVLARSARMHSVNYRSVVIVGTANELTNPGEKTFALRCIMEHMMPGRWAEVRPPNENELKETRLLEIPITEGSAKVRTGPPLHSPLDSDFHVWSGQVPLKTIALQPVPDPDRVEDLTVPQHLQEYLNKWGLR